MWNALIIVDWGDGCRVSCLFQDPTTSRGARVWTDWLPGLLPTTNREHDSPSGELISPFYEESRCAISVLLIPYVLCNDSLKRPSPIAPKRSSTQESAYIRAACKRKKLGEVKLPRFLLVLSDFHLSFLNVW